MSRSTVYCARNPGRHWTVEIPLEQNGDRSASCNNGDLLDNTDEPSIVDEAIIAAPSRPIVVYRPRNGERNGLVEDPSTWTNVDKPPNSINTINSIGSRVTRDCDFNAMPIRNHKISDSYYEVDPEKLTITTKKLGEGHFGEVLMGLLTESDGKKTPVAVKKSRVSMNPDLTVEQRNGHVRQQLQSLECENDIMATMGFHLNVLRLIGAITTNSEAFCVITEYCAYGNLENFLKEKEIEDKFINEYVIHGKDGYQLLTSEFHWKVEDDSSWADNFETRRKDGFITTSDLMWFSLQIARAMEFLAKQSILHRDIALRNVLLAEGFIVKVADFGLSRKTIDGIYQPSLPAEMPIGWLAPEVLQSRQFTIKSECWTFGVLLWEMFTLARCRPYVEECHGEQPNERIICAFLGAGKRLSIPEIAPVSMGKMMTLLWNAEPSERLDLEKAHSMILAELKLANPKLAELAQEMLCYNSFRQLPDRNYGNVALVVPSEQYTLIDGGLVHENTSSRKRTAKLRNVLLLRCIPSLILVALVGLIIVLLSTATPSFQENSRLIAVRWSWSFNASIIFNAKPTKHICGKRGNLSLHNSCKTIKWQPCFVRYENGNVLFMLKYIEGPDDLRAMRSMLLIAEDGREILMSNDYDRNAEGYVYNLKQFDRKTLGTNSTELMSLVQGDRLTLEIEVSIVSTTIRCNNYVKPAVLANYQEECDRLPTHAKKLYINGSCFVGSNTPTQFAFAMRQCNHIPAAAISRLAWVDSNMLLNILRNVLKIHSRTGEKKDVPYYVGAMHFQEKTASSLDNDNWQWIDSDLRPKKSFLANFSLWSELEPTEPHENMYAAIFIDGKKLSAVDGSQYYRYLCEYRGTE